MFKKLKIAQIAPLIERVPPKKYGGTERVIYSLTEELVKKGHDVTLFASGDSKTSAKLVSVYPKSLREVRIKDIYGSNIWGMLNIGVAYSWQDQFDIIHDHNWYMSLPTANLSVTPVVMTLHGPINEENIPLLEALDNINYVSISYSQIKKASNLNWIGNVYNGLDFKDYPFSSKDKGYLLFVGRISKEKGVHLAIEVAKKLKLPLIIAAKLEKNSKSDIYYFQKYIKSQLSDQIRWIGEVEEEERNKLMSEALCFLHPVTWSEPFGLTLIEAMACGTPVVAINKGSIPEVVAHGETGFVVDNIEEMIEAVKSIKQIDRKECRDYSRNNFNAKIMADNYEAVYQSLLSPEYPLYSTDDEVINERMVAYAHDLKIET